MAVLEQLPRARWTEQGPGGQMLLHSACEGNNVAAVATLLAHGVHVDAHTANSGCAAHYAALSSQPRVLELLCAAGADLRATSTAGYSPLDCALIHLPCPDDCVRVLVANGSRLSDAGARYRGLITPELWAFERGVLSCRAVIVALLGIKRRRGDAMCALDRWVVREACYAVWATRTDKAWQPPV